MKFLTIVGAILATAQPLLGQGPQPVCCDAVVMGYDQRFTGIQCVPMAPFDCTQSRRTAAICFLNQATHIGDWCQNVHRAPPR